MLDSINRSNSPVTAHCDLNRPLQTIVPSTFFNWENITVVYFPLLSDLPPSVNSISPPKNPSFFPPNWHSWWWNSSVLRRLLLVFKISSQNLSWWFHLPYNWESGTWWGTHGNKYLPVWEVSGSLLFSGMGLLPWPCNELCVLSDSLWG